MEEPPIFPPSNYSFSRPFFNGENYLWEKLLTDNAFLRVFIIGVIRIQLEKKVFKTISPFLSFIVFGKIRRNVENKYFEYYFPNKRKPGYLGYFYRLNK